MLKYIKLGIFGTNLGSCAVANSIEAAAGMCAGLFPAVNLITHLRMDFTDC